MLKYKEGKYEKQLPTHDQDKWMGRDNADLPDFFTFEPTGAPVHELLKTRSKYLIHYFS